MVLTGRQEEAAALVAADLLSDSAICKRVGIGSRQTLHVWKQRPEFAARVAELRADIRANARLDGIASVDNRVAALNDRWRRLQAIIEARAVELADVPGGETGLLVREVQLVKLHDAGPREDDEPDVEMEPQPHGGALKRTRRTREDILIALKESVEVVSYSIDTGLLRELREHEKQAAQELGQWKEKREETETRRIVVRTITAVQPAAATDGA